MLRLTEVPVCSPGATLRDVAALLARGGYHSVSDIAVCTPPRHLVGLIPVERVLAAAGGERAGDVMDADPPVVEPGLDQEPAAWKAVRHRESSLAVVNDAGVFLGLVPPARLVRLVLRNHDQDFARLGGYLHSTESARHATEEPLGQRLWHRLPWLVIGLVGSAIAAVLVGGFEEQIAADVRVAFFVPGVVYLADAVGTQTEALVIRGLSVGASMRHAFWLETLTGLLLGLLMGAVTFVVVWVVLDSASLAAAVALALLAACCVSTVVAMALPIAMARRGKDPAFGSGPLATVVQDLLSLLIYFAMVALLVA